MTINKRDGSLIAFNTSKLVFQDSSENIIITTDVSFVVNISLFVYSRDGKVPYVMPLNITVLEPDLNVSFNMAPFFNLTPSSVSAIVDPTNP